MSTPSVSFEEWNAQQEKGVASPTESINDVVAFVENAIARFGVTAIIDALLPRFFEYDDEYIEKVVDHALGADEEIVVSRIIERYPKNEHHPLVKPLGNEPHIVEWIAEEYDADDWRSMHSEAECDCPDSGEIASIIRSAIEDLKRAADIAENE